MVFAELHSIKSDMSSNAAGGGSFSNLNTSVPQASKFNPQANPSTSSSMTTSSNETPLPTYDINDPRAILKALIRFTMRTFYDVPKCLVIEYIYHFERIKQQDLANRLCLDPKTVRAYIQEFKKEKFITEDLRLETNDGKNGRRNQDEYYYEIDTTKFINAVKYRLITMQKHVEASERQQVFQQSTYKCEQCGKEYTVLDINKLYNPAKDHLICRHCEGPVREDSESKETTTTVRQVANMSTFNDQMKPLFNILERIDEIMKSEQQMKDSSDPDFQENGYGASKNPNSRGAASFNIHRSHASTVFDRANLINHDIQVILEKDDDDDYSPMEIDETSNTESAISSSRGPGKPGKKTTKGGQSTTESAAQLLSTKMKATSKKAPYEPKHLPPWFVRSTVHVDQDEEQRLNNSANNLSLHPSNSSSTLSRQLSNQKLAKSTTIHDIKQMLLVYESRKNKTLPLTTMEDSLSPPTPLQITRTTDSQ